MKLYPWGHHWKTPIDNFSIFSKTLPHIKTPKKDELIILGSQLGPKSQADLLERKSMILKKLMEMLRIALWFFMLKNCHSLPKLLYFLRTSTCFNHPALLEKYDKTVRDGLSKVCNVNFDDISSTQLAPPTIMGGLGVSSASLLAFWPQLLARVTFSRRFTRKHSKIFHLQKRFRNGWVWRMNRIFLSMESRKTGHNISSSKPPKNWFLEWMTNVRKFSMLSKANSGLNGWTSFPVKTLAWNLMISNFGFQLVYVSEPTFALRIRATVVKELNGTVYTVFLAPRVLVASHVMLLSILSKQTLGSLDLPSMLESRGLYRTDCKRPDGVTMIPWVMGEQPVWDVTVVDALAPSCLNQGSLSNPEPPPLRRLKRVKLRSIAN